MLKLISKLTLAAALIGTSLSAVAQSDYTKLMSLRSLTKGVSEARQMNDGEHFTSSRRGTIVKCSFVDPEFEETLYEAPQGGFRMGSYTLSPNEEFMLITQGYEQIYRHSYTTSYHLHNIATGSTEAIIHDIPSVRDANFSPDNSKLAFSSLNNLYLYDIASKEVTQITRDGEWNKIINGTTDWVYEEELGFTKAFWFSPDGSEIAFLKFDESEVPMFEMMRYDNTLYNKAFAFKYPKAGDTNSTVELWVYNIASAESRKIETARWDDQYLPSVGYTPKGELYYFRLNRLQNHVEVMMLQEDGSQRMIYEEKAPQYIERVGDNTLRFIDDEQFIVMEETSTGFMHLYLHSTSKGRIGAVTSGNWEVTQLITVDMDEKELFYVSTEGSPLRRRIYSIGLNGRRKRQISGAEGYYSIRSTRKMDYFVASFGTATQPSQTAIFNRKGEIVRMLSDNTDLLAALSADNRPMKEFFEITTERGDVLNAYMIRPRNFDESKKYPVIFTQYSGPGSQQVADNWSIDWLDVMADNDYIVMCVDPRGTGFRGEAFKKCTYENLGGLEVEDQISAARYAATLPYVDPARIGIYGWSYGGFMALNCALKSEGLYAMSIAVAPVTSWRYYDSIYTEVYNGLPQDNPAGYDDNSPINFADGLADHTKLLIVHGTADDNVHFQNTMEMVRALNAEGKQYDMMVYPDNNHSMAPGNSTNVREKMIRYALENL